MFVQAGNMKTNAALTKLERKLARNRGAMLNQSEVSLLARVLRQEMARSFPGLDPERAPQADDVIRWHSIGVQCQQARASRGLSIRHASVGLRIPQYRLQAIESGALREFRADMARRYFRFLEIDPWIARWCRANPDLARRAGLQEG
jgi:hypothetical protein